MMRLAEIQRIMRLLSYQQKECHCELLAYNKVKAAYQEYKNYLIKVTMAKQQKLRAETARTMSLRFLRSAVAYRKIANRMRSMSRSLAKKA